MASLKSAPANLWSEEDAIPRCFSFDSAKKPKTVNKPETASAQMQNLTVAGKLKGEKGKLSPFPWLKTCELTILHNFRPQKNKLLRYGFAI